MKKSLVFVSMLLAAAVCGAAPIRVALIDFEDQTGLKPDAALGGAIVPGALASKGVYLLSKDLVGSGAFVLIDRRDFVSQMEKLQPKDMGKDTPTKPTFIHAAQALNADVVLRGNLLSFSQGKQVVDQGGYHTEFSKVTLRVGLEALDAVDGTVVALADGVASENFRQTQETFTTLSEDDVIGLFEKAIGNALPNIQAGLEQKMAKEAARPKVKLSIKTDADPALVEIDGILVGSTPVEGLEVYQGDHVLTLGKAGYQDVTKRILFEKNASIEVPMIRTQLSAEEWKQVLEKARLNLFNVTPDIVITETKE